MTKAVYDYRLYCDSEIKQLEAILQEQHSKWLSEWGQKSDAKLQLSIMTDLPLSDQSWLIDGDVVLNLASFPWAFMSKLCFGYEVTQNQYTAPLCKSVLDKMLRSYLETLFGLDCIPTEKQAVLPEKFRQVGCLLVVCHAEDMCLKLVLSPVQVAQLLNKPALNVEPLSPFSINQLPVDGSVCLHVHSCPTDLTIGELSNINIGDVLKLDHKINQPFELRSADQQIVGKVTLGCVNNQLSIRVYSN